jgi:glyceraldehyde 3-phosphate dehydrogenase
MIRVAINGFGRIGRRVFRLALQHPRIEIVAINDLADARTLSHLLKYDSIHGVLDNNVSYKENAIIVDNITTPLYNETHPKNINWKNVKPDIVIDSTGKFKSKQDLLVSY